MDQKIVKLPELVVNQIAAGEVVESPASIVKELIENSLDAGAKRINVEIVAGGHQLIRVEDDGCGMGRADALLCLERHATSKIQSIDDLSRLSTMGFRGEALAAIASVSHLELKTFDGKGGTRILAEGGKVGLVETCARNRGTTVEIRCLFYNVPARKKFQKSQSASTLAISRIIETLALAHPDIAFSWNQKEFFPTTLQARIEEIVGKHEHEVKSKGVFGYVAGLSRAMAMRTGQYLYINKRPIFSPLVAKAVKEAFGTRIGEYMYPRFVLFIEIAPDQVDINVHPQKKEARFREEATLFLMVRKAVETIFAPKAPFLKPLSFTPPSENTFFESFPPLPFKVEETEFAWISTERPLAVFGPFLLLQTEGLLLIDLRAAHARVLFETLRFEKGVAQTLLVPLEIPLSAGEEERVMQLEELGIECRILKNRLVIDALPPFLGASDFSQFYAEWKGGKKIEETATRFCRSRQKTFSLEQALHLWKEVQKCKDSLYDPLGSPIFAKVGEEDFAKILKSHG